MSVSGGPSRAAPRLVSLRGELMTHRRTHLLALFAKEVALRAHGVPGSEEALESLVEILAHAERNLASV